MVKTIHQSFSSCSILDFLNETLLVLILKMRILSLISHFKPISLCTTIYEIILKILVFRIRLLLDELISTYQVAFILKRQACDNIIIAQEILHFPKLKKGSKGLMLIKIHLEKAYDKLEWNFIDSMLNLYKFLLLLSNSS